ncbi:bacteriocin [Enterobacteriaceae bacterium YMB-R22]|nr:bacteriocin [Tenebrionicola larvae]MBV4413941.1 bacteriocin [Tenebrionicola larvae]
MRVLTEKELDAVSGGTKGLFYDAGEALGKFINGLIGNKKK